LKHTSVVQEKISYHMIRGTGVTCRQRRLSLCFVLAMKMRQAPTENNIERTKHISELERIAPIGCQTNIVKCSSKILLT